MTTRNAGRRELIAATDAARALRADVVRPFALPGVAAKEKPPR
ncbi:hypothetical protein K788_0009087 [Paraburkholderia caribensis MBA4]|uniref:Uncharacterized protein n=1 Tax=Paraburkholderia caribensis MBA4 TaxID=1323664 RepID=A0A0P0R5V6_9BURK|nr:hypothetical protein K788_0009087 [Paraburkholderia caribensis MBA4]